MNNPLTDNVIVLMSQVLRRRRSFSSATIRRAVDRKNASLGTTSSRHEPSVRSGATGRAPPPRVKNKALFGTIRRRLKSIGKQKKVSGYDDDNTGTCTNITNTTLHPFFTYLLYVLM